MADDAYKHQAHKGKFNRPSEPQTELDHDDLHEKHAEHFAEHNKGMHNSGEHLAELINPGSTKGNSSGGSQGEDNSQVAVKNEADRGMEPKKKSRDDVERENEEAEEQRK